MDNQHYSPAADPSQESHPPSVGAEDFPEVPDEQRRLLAMLLSVQAVLLACLIGSVFASQRFWVNLVGLLLSDPAWTLARLNALEPFPTPGAEPVVSLLRTEVKDG